MNDFLHIEDQEYVFLGEGSQITGNVLLSGDTRLAAHIEGDVVMKGDSPLIVEPKGKIVGTVKCTSLEVFGEVSGQVDVSGNLIVHPYAKLSGNINAQNFIIKPGAIINISGHSTSAEPNL